VLFRSYADGADLEEMIELNKNPMISGFTSNPSLMRKAGIDDYETFAKEVLKYIAEKPISFEVFSDDLDEMYRQAKLISAWGKNVFVKIPITNTLGIKTNQLFRRLANEAVKVNVTAVFTTEQINDAIEFLENKNSIISIFAGRISDCGKDAEWFVEYAAYRKYFKQKILWASTRQVFNIVQAENCGADIITVPNDILKKMNLIGKDLKEMSLDTVKMFRQDAVQSGYKL
jgi:transaldolase